MLGIAVSVAALILSAALWHSNPSIAYAHISIAAGISVFFAYLAINETRDLIREGASRASIAASSARFMGLVWAWGALGLVATYGTSILIWKEWMSFFAAMVALAGLCLVFSSLLSKDAAAGKEDETMLRAARYLAMFQLAGMVIAMLGLLIDGKMTRFTVPRYTDWAANNFFFFGALALAAISGFAIKTSGAKSGA